ncbi:MAG TPA: 23S rRNA (uracil(1939)-C(5))-methyltransferase RlmD [Bacilli bacterium]|nr:23S rRNA (uracil(1939)-C(5))-methyltransferase RlmD [Bacilli bacterium]
MKVNEILKLKATDLNHNGYGVARHNNLVVFVPYLLKNEEANVKIISVKKNYSFGVIDKITKPSKDRVEPVCKHYYECGGCSLLHLNYEAQLKHKLDSAQRTLKKLGNIDLEIKDIYGKDQYHYRNKVQMFYSQDKQIYSGFYQEQTHDVFKLEECYLQTKTASKISVTLDKILNKYQVPIYNEKTKAGLLRAILIRNNQKGEYVVVLISKEDKINNLDRIVKELVKEHPEIIQVHLNVNSKSTNVILGSKTKELYFKKKFIEEIFDLKFELNYNSFFQINYDVMLMLYKEIVDKVKNLKIKKAIDAYCGVGTISLLLSKYVSEVIGIEVVFEAIKNADNNKKINNIKNAKFILGKTEEKLLSINNIDLLVVDPPRKGLEDSLIDTIKQKEIKHIIYVSCNEATLARDLGLLKDEYNVKEIKAFDMFPNTNSLECLAYLERKPKVK